MKEIILFHRLLFLSGDPLARKENKNPRKISVKIVAKRLLIFNVNNFALKILIGVHLTK